MKFLLSLFAMMFIVTANAQFTDTLYGLARNNNPAEVYLAKMDPATGIVSNYGTTSISEVINLTGAAMNAYDNSYHFVGIDEILTVDLATGALTNTATIVNPIANSYFDNFRFNNSDSTLYGLARRYIQATQTGELYLATIDAQTGVVTQISPSSVGQGFALEGSAIDPYQKVYYYSDGSNLIGLDMYNGSVYSNVPITFPGGGNFFGNFAYSCKDTTLYGLVRENFYTNQMFDSAHVYLGTIDPATGVVTNISNTNISPIGGYSVNAGATINPTTSEYYFSDGSDFIGVSLLSGNVTNQQSYTHDNGCQYFDMMRIHSNCVAATAIRIDPSSNASVSELNLSTLKVFPNPTQAVLELQSTVPTEEIEILNASGQVLLKRDYQSGLKIQVDKFESGIYIIRAYHANGMISQERFIKE